VQKQGYWIKGNKIIDVSDTSHINFILQHPQDFNLTKERILDTYNKYGEKLGVEGRARDEIIKKVSRAEWIRVRHYIEQRDYWSIQFDKFDTRKRTIRNFVEWAVFDKKVMSKNDTLVLIGFDNNYFAVYDFKNEGASAFLKENEAAKIKMILIDWREYKSLGEIDG